MQPVVNRCSVGAIPRLGSWRAVSVARRRLPRAERTRGAAGEPEPLGTYTNQNSGLESFENPKNIGNQRLKRFDTVAWCHKHYDSHGQSPQVLLEFDVLVSSQQRVKLCGGLLKKGAVTQTGPAHLGDGANVVAYQ